jgi:hypothetical protein
MIPDWGAAAQLRDGVCMPAGAPHTGADEASEHNRADVFTLQPRRSRLRNVHSASMGRTRRSGRGVRFVHLRSLSASVRPASCQCAPQLHSCRRAV